MTQDSINTAPSKVFEELHKRAMAWAEQALVARVRGNTAVALDNLKQAFHLEAVAAELASDCPEPLRSVIFRSAAALACECHERDEAKRLVERGLAGNPPEAIREELRQVSVVIQQHATLPRQLLAARQRLAFNPRMAARAVADPNSYFIIDSPHYCALPAVERLRTELIKTITHDNLGLGTPKRNPPHPNYDAATDPELAESNAAIYVFPFFLPEPRHALWGVLPYGIHRRVGLVCHQQHDAVHFVREWERDSRDGNCSPEPYLAAVLQELEQVGGKIRSVRGYLNDEIIPLMIGETEVGGLIYKVLERKGLRPGVGVPADFHDDTRDVLVVDLAHKAQVKRELPGDCLFAELAHGLDFPIGVGFSLLAVPLLLKDDRWKSVANVAASILGTAEAITNLRSIGIDPVETTG